MVAFILYALRIVGREEEKTAVVAVRSCLKSIFTCFMTTLDMRKA